VLLLPPKAAAKAAGEPANSGLLLLLTGPIPSEHVGPNMPAQLSATRAAARSRSHRQRSDDRKRRSTGGREKFGI